MKSLLMLFIISMVPVSFTGCGEKAETKETVSKKSATAKTEAIVSADNVLKENKGKVLVLLLGMEGCPGTEKSTPYLVEYSQTKPEGVEIYRIDVPPSIKEPLEPASELDPDLKYMLDNSRKLADKFEFFFYPTLYILDQDGDVRYYGECEGENVEKMVSEILKEKRDSVKKMYTPELPAIGTTAFNFTGKTLDDTKISLKIISQGADANLLLFSKTSCPFSNKAVVSLDKINEEFKGKALSITVINIGQPTDKIKEFYTSEAPGRVVIVDPDDSISKKNYGVSAVPFFYLLDKDLKIVERKPYTKDLARAAVAKALGLKTSGGETSSGAG